MAQKNFKVNNGLTTPLVSLLDINGNTVNLSTTTNTLSYDLYLPVNDGTSGQVLITDGAGNLSWSSSVGTPTSIVNGNSNVVVNANANITISSNGQSNIVTVSSDATNGLVTVSGNVTGANVISANTLTTAANGAVIFVGNNGTTTQQVTLQASTAAGFTANYILTLPVDDGTSGQYLQTNGTGVLSWESVSTSSIANGNSNVNIPAANGNVNISAVGNANVLVVTGTGVNVAGTLNATGNANVGNLETTTAIVTTGNITTVNTGLVQNGNSNVTITANANVTITSKSNATMVITDTGANITGTGNFSANLSAANLVTGGNVFAQSIVQNASTYDTRVSLGSASGIIEANTNGNATQFLPGGQIRLSGAATIYGGTLDGSQFVLGAAQTDLVQNRGGNVTVQVGSGGTTANTWTFAQDGSLTVPGNVNASKLQNGNSNIAITANANITLTAKSNATMLITDTGANITGTANISSDLRTGGNLTVNGTGISSIAGNIDMNGKWVGNIGYAVADTDAASKLYVDTLVSTGISYHSPVNAATTTTLATATGGTTAYNQPNGAGNGIGAYISTTGTFTTIDGVTINGSTSIRILVKDEANASWNGVYNYTNATAITRSTDADEYGVGSPTTLSINDYFFTQAGTVNAGTAFIVSDPPGTITFGTSNITFSIFSTSQVYTGGTGITVSGTVISANASQTQITAVGTLGTLDVSGNANTGNLGTNTAIITTGNITTVNTGLVQNGNSNVAITANANVSISSTGNANILVITGTGANITGTANVTGNLSVGNITTAAITANGNIDFTGANVSLGAVGNLHITGGSSGQLLTTDGSGNLSWTTGAGSSSNIANGTSNVNIPAVNGNVNISSAGNANVVVVTGTDTLFGSNIQVGAVNANSGLVFNANTFQTKLFASNALVANYSLYLPANVAQSNGLSLLANTDGTLRFAAAFTAQPTIKFTAGSTGNNQTFTDANIANFGNSTAYSSVYRNGVLVDSADYSFSDTTLTMNVVLVTGDTVAVGSTNASSMTPGDAIAGGSNTQVQFNDNSTFGGNSSFTFNKTNSTLSVGNLTLTGNISGNVGGFSIGYLNIPQLPASNTTLALTDAGKHYYSTTVGNYTLTIPNNSSVSFATGTSISIVVQAAGNVLVNAASGVTLYLAGLSTPANRVVGAYGMATLIKVATNTWFINGTQVT